MTALEDRRPVAAVTASSSHPNTIADDLAGLLVEHPDLELASIRFIPNDDGTVGIAGRIGQLAGVECPQCHQPIGREHTEYCTLAPGKVWDGVLPEPVSYEGPAPTPNCGIRDLTRDDMPACTYPPHQIGASHSWQDFRP